MSQKELTLDYITNFLRDHDLKVTKFRQELLKLFLDHQVHSLSTAAIMQKLKKNLKAINLSSVYNNLDVLCRIGVLKVNINLVTNMPTYELALDSDPHIHAYNIDANHESIIGVDCDLHYTLKTYFLNRGMQLEDYIIQATYKKIGDSQDQGDK